MARNEPISEKAWPEIAHFAKQFKAAREEMGLSQRELSAKIELDQGYISKVESRRVNPQLTTLILLARMVDKPVSYFIMDRDFTVYGAPDRDQA